MPPPLVTLEDIHEAQSRVDATCVRTPVLRVPHPAGDGSLWIKAESLQRTGSFKVRGATNALLALGDRARSGVVTYSAGNHGRGLAHAGRFAGVAVTVVMPESAPNAKVAGTRAEGATVILRPPDEIVSHAHELSAEHGMALVPPFDDAHVIAGQGTVGLELLEQIDDLGTVLVPVGGGGLISGVAAAVKSRRPAARVLAVEPALAGDLAESLATGERTAWSRELTGRTIADGLRSAAVGELTWRHITALVDDVVTVSEDSIVDAVRWIAEHARLVVEPSGAVAMAGVLEHPDRVGSGTTVVLATGGNIDLPAFTALLAT